MVKLTTKIFGKDYKFDSTKVLHSYKERKDIHKKLVDLLEKKRDDEYIKLALGITDPMGNFSADEHNLGPQILTQNRSESIVKLAQNLRCCLDVSHIPDTIYKANLNNLKISVGSEMAMMLRPQDFWVANVRTIWAHLLIKHECDRKKANKELELYRDNDMNSKMAYELWKYIYLSMETHLNKIYKEVKIMKKAPEQFKYLWIDSICNQCYERKDE
ncbi:hypothetical protein KAU39_02560 [bacterium]|nr:hypothetical protein [bacterium]